MVAVVAVVEIELAEGADDSEGLSLSLLDSVLLIIEEILIPSEFK